MCCATEKRPLPNGISGAIEIIQAHERDNSGWLHKEAYCLPHDHPEASITNIDLTLLIGVTLRMGAYDGDFITYRESVNL